MVYDLFSKRRKIERGEVPDVYTYEEIPQQLVIQTVHIFHQTFDRLQNFAIIRNEPFTIMVKVLRKERGVFKLPHHPCHARTYKDDEEDYEYEAINYFLQEESAEKALDVI